MTETSTRHHTDLVPVADRYRWMLACRALLTALLAGFLVPGAPGGRSGLAIAAAACAWLVVTGVLFPLARHSRRAAVVAFAVGLLGDGIVLGAAWWALGAPGNGVEALVAVHVLATTLLASFRTGMKLAFWHSCVALVTLECVAAGLFGEPAPVPVPALATYVGALWLIAVLTATFAAANERELRRRRYDSEVLRQLIMDLTHHQTPVDVVGTLARFGRDEILAERVAVIAHPRGEAGDSPGFAVVVCPGSERIVANLPRRSTAEDVTGAVVGEPAPTLLRRLGPESDPALADLLPDARNVMIVPFVLEQVVGVVALTHEQWSRRRSAQRVERRLVATMHQATLQAAMALSRVLLMERIRLAAETDALTGLANRGTFTRALNQAVANAGRGDPRFALILIDLDDFKKLNDTHGHQAGDDVLRTAATAISVACRDDDLPARYGGEEFVVILPDTTEVTAHAVAERIRRAIAAAPTLVPVTASLGLAVCPDHGADGDAVVAAADSALYESKRRGRNRVTVGRARKCAPTPAPG